MNTNKWMYVSIGQAIGGFSLMFIYWLLDGKLNYGGFLGYSVAALLLSYWDWKKQ